MKFLSVKHGGIALIIGGALWAILMIAYVNTHGWGSHDYKNLLFGLSREDYMKFMCIPILLMAYGMFNLRSRFKPLMGSLFSITSGAAFIILIVISFGFAIEYWSLPWGTHRPWPNNDIVGMIGGIIQFIGFPLLGLSLALMCIALIRKDQFRAGAFVLIFPVSVIALVPWQPIHGLPGIVFGIGWMIVGLMYVSARRRHSK
jgi:hypothetical protein